MRYSDALLRLDRLGTGLRRFIGPRPSSHRANEGMRATGLEPATSGVTGRRSNPLNYARHSPKQRAER